MIRWIVLTLLAWLGLAGLSDNIVVWQDWFEQGVIEHWRSVKEWTLAVLLWWLPFEVPSWAIDYVVISALVMRAAPLLSWGDLEFLPIKDREFPLVFRLELVAIGAIVLLLFRIGIFLLWPIGLPMLLTEVIRGEHFFEKGKVSSIQRRSVLSWLRKITWFGISFIPVLFVCSTLLYEHG